MTNPQRRKKRKKEKGREKEIGAHLAALARSEPTGQILCTIDARICTTSISLPFGSFFLPFPPNVFPHGVQSGAEEGGYGN